MMKQHIVLFFFVLLFSPFLASSRLIVDTTQGEIEVKVNDKTLVQDDMQELMGSEKCHEKDEECLKRRMMEEAHLDYIYSQRRPPPAAPMQ